jgi:hypothetical protein
MKISKNRKHEPKHCRSCSVLLDENNSTEYDRRHAKYICTICLREKNQKKYAINKQMMREHQKDYERSNKLKIIEAYGGKCACCGETIIEFLTIDHVNNNGAEERKETKQGTGGKLYRWLIKHNFPKDNYQLLCYNCNCAKGFFGYCPHNKN